MRPPKSASMRSVMLTFLLIRARRKLFIVSAIFLLVLFIFYGSLPSFDYKRLKVDNKLKMTLDHERRRDADVLVYDADDVSRSGQALDGEAGWAAVAAVIGGAAVQKTLQDVASANASSSWSTINSTTASPDAIQLRAMSKQAKYVPHQVLVHLDFKGAPPRVKYLVQLLPLLRSMGATGLLVEYEDMFPYWGPLTSISARNALSYEDIKTLVIIAEMNHLEIIPLVQTFGHMEFVLKGPEFKYLREVPSFPQTICPSKQDSMILVQTMIDQVIALHPGIKWLHIGCDEVFHLGMCRMCHQQMSNISREYSQHPRSYLFLKHVREVALYVKNNYGIQPIVWDDMFRGIPSEYIIKSGIHDGLVEPMVWAYSTEIYKYLDSDMWHKYSEVFPNVWTAGAFKGAFGETSFLVDIYQHVMNAAEWMTVMRLESGKFRHFHGFALTGWQRYDHFSVLCELLPSSVPSLAVTLLTASHGRITDQVLRNVSAILSCPDRVTVPTLDHLSSDHFLRILASCDFPGSYAFHVMRSLQSQKIMVAKHLQKMAVGDGWLVPYTWRRHFANPFRVRSALQRTTILLKNVVALKKNTLLALIRYFETNTVNEWVEQQIEPLLSALQFAEAKMKPILDRSVWPRRPLP